MKDLQIFIPTSNKLAASQKSDLYKFVNIDEKQIPEFETKYSDFITRRDLYGKFVLQYWVWKNINADFYGIYKDNTFLCFEELKEKDENRKLPDEKEFEFIKDYDLCIQSPLILGKSNLESNISLGKYIIDLSSLDLCRRCIEKNFPEKSSSVQEYLSQNKILSGSFILSKKQFFELCQFQFIILSDLEKLVNISRLALFELNILERCGEFLFGYFIWERLEQLKIYFSKGLYKDDVCNESLLPAFDEKNITIVLASSDYFVPYLAVCIQSIVNTSSLDNYYDIIIMERNISLGNKVKIERLLREDQKNISIRFFHVKLHNVKFYLNSGRISEETYYGLLAPWFLLNHSRGIIMDCDMIVKKDIASLYDVDLEDCIGGGVNDIVLKGWLNIPTNDTYTYYVDDVHIKDPFSCFNGGLILLDFTKYRNFISRKQIAYYLENFEFRVVDQDIFNILLEGRAKLIDVRWNHMIYSEGAFADAVAHAPADDNRRYFEAKKAPFIIHYASERKPWFFPEVEFGEDFWFTARQTGFYEVILARLSAKIATAADYSRQLLGDRRSFLRRLFDKMAPRNSKRRYVAKVLIPRNSIRWKILHFIYLSVRK